MTVVKVVSQSLGQTCEIGRYIGKLKGNKPGPSIVLTAGIHGNEPAGVFALQKAVDLLKRNEISIKGNIYALAGSLWGLENQQRFQKEDLNRLWSEERVDLIKNNGLPITNEDEKEQVELYQCISQILENDRGPFYFMDLHTTSSETIPFIVVNDMLLNRKFTARYPLPTIIGIEEYLEGPLLSYINELGYVAFGFEAGQHDDVTSIENHLAFTMISLVFAGCIRKEDIDFSHYFSVLARHTVDMNHFYEILYRYKINDDEGFKMEPGYVNFQNVKKGEKLAVHNGKIIRADRNAKVFMPLYQSQGSEGFFAIRKVPRRFLNWSLTLRKLQLDRLLATLPGISWEDPDRKVLRVNRRVARFFTKPFFHLMGYRSKQLDKDHYLMKNREVTSREQEYKDENWW